MALWGLENEGLMSIKELVLYSSPYLTLPFYSYGEVERLSSPYVGTAFALYDEGLISYLTSYSYRPTRVHLLGSDWVLGLVHSDDEALYLYGIVTLYPSRRSSVATPPTPSTFPPPHPYYSRIGLLYW